MLPTPEHQFAPLSLEQQAQFRLWQQQQALGQQMVQPIGGMPFGLQQQQQQQQQQQPSIVGSQGSVVGGATNQAFNPSSQAFTGQQQIQGVSMGQQSLGQQHQPLQPTNVQPVRVLSAPARPLP